MNHDHKFDTSELQIDCKYSLAPFKIEQNDFNSHFIKKEIKIKKEEQNQESDFNELEPSFEIDDPEIYNQNCTTSLQSKSQDFFEPPPDRKLKPDFDPRCQPEKSEKCANTISTTTNTNTRSNNEKAAKIKIKNLTYLIKMCLKEAKSHTCTVTEISEFVTSKCPEEKGESWMISCKNEIQKKLMSNDLFAISETDQYFYTGGVRWTLREKLPLKVKKTVRYCSRKLSKYKNSQKKCSTETEANTHNNIEKQTSQDFSKPDMNFIELIIYTLMTGEKKILTSHEITMAISTHFPYYNDWDKNWKNSIRNGLSSNNYFVKELNPRHSRAALWKLNPKRIDKISTIYEKVKSKLP